VLSNRFALLRRIAWCCLALVAAPPADAQSLTYLVGGDGASCDFAGIQAAIDAAQNHPGPDIIRVAMSANFSAQALRVGAQDLEIIGGFANCASVAPSLGANTTISGTGGAVDSVIVITGVGERTLRNLTVSGGDDTGSSVGGGIDFAGDGVLVLNHVILSQNSAGYGGGINFRGTGSGARAVLALDGDVVVQNNVAINSGGGIRVEGNARLFMIGAGSTVTGNEARGVISGSGYGGGIQIVPPAVAEIGSPGAGNIGAVAFNQAKYGGGIAVSARDDGGSVGYALLYTIDPLRPVRVHNNIASVAGGGVYLSVNNDFIPLRSEVTFLCAYEFRIDHNQALDGAGIYLGSQNNGSVPVGAEVALNSAEPKCDVPGLPPSPFARQCAGGVACNRIDGNEVRLANGQPGTGAVVFLGEDARLVAKRTSWLANSGLDLVRADVVFDTAFGQRMQLTDCLIADNQIGRRLIQADRDAAIAGCTVAGNTVGATSLFALSGPLDIRHTILWQPGKGALAQGHGAIGGGYVLGNDVSELGLGGTAISTDPRFIDSAAGDYRLQAASPAVDYAPAVAGNDIDLDALQRDRDIPVHVDKFGTRDLGAYERATALPLVLNGNFDFNVSHWFEATPAISARDPNEDATHLGTLGAMSFDWLNGPVLIGAPRIVSRQQCVYLPGPGNYRLNGSARTTGSNAINVQTALLHWELRRDGGSSCNGGAFTNEGDLPLATGTAWARPAQPTTITVLPGGWTPNSSITVSMVMRFNGISVPQGMHGWFDDVTLDVDGASVDGLFGDGFE
jgi:predicted outer membrane repeat protein